MSKKPEIEVTILTFTIRGEKKAIKRCISDDSIVDTIESVMSDDISEIYPSPGFHLRCNSVVILRYTLFVSIHSSSGHINYKRVANFIIEKFNSYFKVDPDNDFPSALTLTLNEIEKERPLSELKEIAYLPGFEASHIEYGDHSGEEDNVFVTFKRKYKVPKNKSS